MRRLLVTAGVLALVAGGAQASTLSSGLRGKVFEQAGGACLEGTNCLRPATGVTLAFSRTSGGTVRMTTHADGTYRVLLRPGAYRVKVVGEGPLARVRPSLSTVQSGRMKAVDFVVVTPAIAKIP